MFGNVCIHPRLKNYFNPKILKLWQIMYCKEMPAAQGITTIT